MARTRRESVAAKPKRAASGKVIANGQKGRRRALAAAADAFGDFGVARDTLTLVRAVPTCFLQVDHGVGVGGWPIDRVSVIHGPSNEGKTLFMLGLIASFLKLEHFAYFVDAERTTPIDWVRKVLGPLADSDRFRALRPSSYEQTVDKVRAFCKQVAHLRQAKQVAADTTALVVVDSLRKLNPEDILTKIAKQGASGEKGSVDGMGGRAAQIRAAYNAAWMDELVPLMDDTGCGFATIARESEDPEADVWARRAGTNYKVGGGKALIYDSSIVARIQRDSWIVDERGGEKKVYGERHKVAIRKTKIAGKENRQTICYFHSSNGVLIPEGFDRARDVLDLGERFGEVVRENGVKWAKGMRPRNVHDAVKHLTETPDELVDLEARVRARFAQVAPIEHDEDGVVVEGGST